MDVRSKKKSYLRYHLNRRIIDYKKKRLALKEKKNELQFEKALLKIDERKEQRKERRLSSSSSSTLSSSSESSFISNITSTSPNDVTDQNKEVFTNEPCLRSSTPYCTNFKTPSSTTTSPAPAQASKYDNSLLPLMELAVQIKNNEWKLPPLVQNQWQLVDLKPPICLAEKHAFEEVMLNGYVVVAEESVNMEDVSPGFGEENKCIEWGNEEVLDYVFKDARPTSLPRRSTL
ncbi:uncharacterized protein LOC127011502 [Drosophila biarmipes]|uniref:uncharacterized protein LOC127011502 n=1 Tax=Drosophila biarmipes TaxID=125945 RepID=UPI0021CCD209|nr:uncharacterized protein LOC127011502 [Drosophila biarmipes]